MCLIRLGSTGGEEEDPKDWTEEEDKEAVRGAVGGSDHPLPVVEAVRGFLFPQTALL